MTAFTRREFGRMVGAGVPLAWASARAAAAGRLTIGVTTDSFRELPRIEGRDNVDDVLQAVRAVGATCIDLALAHLEPAPPNTAPFLGGSQAYPRLIVLTPQEVMATNARARAGLRAWRLQDHAGFFHGVRQQLADAGLTVHACTVPLDGTFTDGELDATFRQVRALGVARLASPLTLDMAARLVPFAERHELSIAIHNQAGTVMTSADLARALALSSVFSVKLDVGDLTASNCDVLTELHGVLPRLSHVVLKDRLRNNGPSQVFGEGDTPLAAVVEALRGSPRPVPVFVEYDYVGLRSPVDEVTASLAFVHRLASNPAGH